MSDVVVIAEFAERISAALRTAVIADRRSAVGTFSHGRLAARRTYFAVTRSEDLDDHLSRQVKHLYASSVRILGKVKTGCVLFPAKLGVARVPGTKRPGQESCPSGCLPRIDIPSYGPAGRQ